MGRKPKRLVLRAIPKEVLSGCRITLKDLNLSKLFIWLIGFGSVLFNRYLREVGAHSYDGILLSTAVPATPIGIFGWGLTEDLIHYNRQTGKNTSALRAALSVCGPPHSCAGDPP